MKRSGISYIEFLAEDLMIDLVTGEDGQNIILVIFSVMKQTQSEEIAAFDIKVKQRLNLFWSDETKPILFHMSED